ncbi:MAG: hypothetical protein SGPRY_004320, partial [Prymnesium sp.]
VPLGFTSGWVVIARRDGCDDMTNANQGQGTAIADGVVVQRFPWESKLGRSGWEVQRRAARQPLEPSSVTLHKLLCGAAS